MPDHSQFSTDRTYPGRWTITFSNPPINMFLPTTIVELARCAGAARQDPQYGLRCSERFRIELRQAPACARAGGRR